MRSVVIDSNRIFLNGHAIDTAGNSGQALLSYIYRSRESGYPKFHKMDPLCRLGFIGAELLLDGDMMNSNDSHAVVVIGHGGSIVDDTRYQATITNPDNYFPSPAVFVYTLANIVTGEIAIRHKLYGESSSFLIENYDPATIATLLLTAFANQGTERITGGWIDCEDVDNFSLRFLTIDCATPFDDILEFFKSNPIK